MSSKEESDINALAQEKAEEILYKQKIQKLSVEVSEVLKLLPESLGNLRRSIDLLDLDSKEELNSISEIKNLMSNINKLIEKDLNNLGDKIRELSKNYSELIETNKELHEDFLKLKNSILDKNDTQSLSVQLSKLIEDMEKKISDKNNESSLINIISKEFIKINEKTQKAVNIRTWITWAITSITAIIVIISKLAGIF